MLALPVGQITGGYLRLIELNRGLFAQKPGPKYIIQQWPNIQKEWPILPNVGKLFAGWLRYVAWFSGDVWVWRLFDMRLQ